MYTNYIKLLNKIIYTAFSYVLLLNSSLLAESVEFCDLDNCFNKQQLVEEKLNLKSFANFRYWGISAYYAALYTPKTIDQKNIFDVKPKALEIYYKYSFEPKDFKVSSREVLKENPKRPDLKFKNCLEELDNLYKPIAPGDRYTIVHTENEGLALYHNHALLGKVCDDSFANAYLSIWLSNEYSLKSSFQNDLLGELAESADLEIY
jgi:hypothetical protein